MRFDLIGFDDAAYVLQHDWVRAGITWHGIVTAFTTDGGIYWHPLTWLSHMVDAAIFGQDAGARHLQNIFGMLVRCCSSALHAAFRLRSGGRWRNTLLGVASAARGSVARVAGRKDVLSGFFFLMCLWLYTNYAAALNAAATQPCCAAARYLPPSIVTLPFVLLLFDWWPLERRWR